MHKTTKILLLLRFYYFYDKLKPKYDDIDTFSTIYNSILE